MDDLENEVRKVRDQVRMIGEAMLPWDDFPIERLVIEMDWGDDELRDARDIFERFDEQFARTGSTSGFEQAMRDRFRIDHQRLKTIVLAFFDAGEYVPVCRSYAGPDPVSEFRRILKPQQRPRGET